MLMNMYCLIETCGQVSIKFAAKEGVQPMDMALSRMLLNFFIPACLAIANKTDLSVPKKHYSVLGIRIVFGFVCFAFIVYSFSVLPIGLVQTLFGTAPFFAAILGYFFIGEGVSKV